MSPGDVWRPTFYPSLPASGAVTVFHFSQRCGGTSPVFNLHFLIAHEAQYLFVSIVFINLFSSVKCLLVSPIFKLGCFVWCCGVLTVTFILYIHVFVRQVAGKQFLPDWSLFFHSFNRVFLRAKALILMKSSRSVFPFMDCGFGVKPKNFLPRLRSCRFSPIFF